LRKLNPLKTFTLYRSSAGSGKTRTLAKEYLKWALGKKADYFRHILAVTFTNKATQEMKERVLAYLADFSGKSEKPRQDSPALADELKKELKFTDVDFRDNADELLTRILHHYDQFSISTIDAFFQRVIRSFTRESGLLGDYRLEAELETVLSEVIGNLIDDLKEDDTLTEWVVRFAQEELESGKSWDIRRRLENFSLEIFRDEFKVIEEELARHGADPKFFRKLQAELVEIRKRFIDKVSPLARRALEIMNEHGLELHHFRRKGQSGIKTYFKSFAYVDNLRKLEIGAYMRSEFPDPKKWPGDNLSRNKEILQLATEVFAPAVQKINKAYDEEFSRAITADLILQNLYVFGLISEITKKLAEYKNEHNVMLLADAPKFLNKIIGDSDTPFVYEKVGSFYRNYLIDEFQDTSGFQWKNFFPLLANSLDQGDPGMVVGDVKQAIYRWRGGDLNLLETQIESEIGKQRIDPRALDKNFRSTPEIIEFNNALFSAVTGEVSTALGSDLPSIVYRDVHQETSRTDHGFVQVRFLSQDKNEEENWMERSLKMLAKDIESLQLKGVRPGEIAILVRSNEEGQRAADSLLLHKQSSKAVEGVSYAVMSNESLRINGAASVNLVLSALRHLSNPDDVIARAQLCYEYGRVHHPDRLARDVFEDSAKVFFESQVPAAFTAHKLSLKKLPLFELTETLIDLFNLGKQQGELAYLQAFQDIVLDFYTRERNDIAAFLEWWEEFQDKDATSIKLSGEVDAINIMTIHKAKGLQFKYVLIPFCSWNFDHDGFKAPYLWVSSKQPPYSGAPYFPVKYVKQLQQTEFAATYEEEKRRTYLDNLNLLYVALTRAENGMIITAPGKGHGRGVAQWMENAIAALAEAGPFKEAWSDSAKELKIGVLSSVKRKADSVPPQELKGYTVSQWRDKLVIRQSGNLFFDGMNPQTRKRISYGVYLHKVMSRISVLEDADPTIDRLVREGLMTHTEQKEFAPVVNELLANPEIRNWFSGAWDVRTEVPILLPGGTTNRIDRLMLKGKQAVVVDYKTGEPSRSDHQQVSEYLDILRKMGFTDVEGFLLYTRDRNVVAVGRGKPKAKKKGPDGQLDLDL